MICAWRGSAAAGAAGGVAASGTFFASAWGDGAVAEGAVFAWFGGDCWANASPATAKKSPAASRDKRQEPHGWNRETLEEGSIGAQSVSGYCAFNAALRFFASCSILSAFAAALAIDSLVLGFATSACMRSESETS